MTRAREKGSVARPYRGVIKSKKKESISFLRINSFRLFGTKNRLRGGLVNSRSR